MENTDNPSIQIYINKIKIIITFRIKTGNYLEVLTPQQDSSFLCKFVCSKSFGQLLDNSPKNFVFLKSFDSDFPYIKVEFTADLTGNKIFNRNTKVLGNSP